MNQKEFKLIFMGTPEFAVFTLDQLLCNGFSIAAVVTAPDKPAGRGQLLHQSAVKQYALSKNIQILQPISLKDPKFIKELNSFNANLFVVVAFRMLPEIVWSMPSHGTINLHASLLPKYRGAAPINWVVMKGEKETGATTFFIEKEIDTGNIIEQTTLSIAENETAGELHDRLMVSGSQLIISTVKHIIDGTVKAIPQSQLKSENDFLAPKLFKKDCEINWNLPVGEVHNFVRGLSPVPAAWSFILNNKNGEQKSFKFFKSEVTQQKVVEKHKIVISESGILFPCNDYYLKITEIQMEGKKRMHFNDFLLGNSLENCEIVAPISL